MRLFLALAIAACSKQDPLCANPNPGERIGDPIAVDSQRLYLSYFNGTAATSFVGTVRRDGSAAVTTLATGGVDCCVNLFANELVWAAGADPPELRMTDVNTGSTARIRRQREPAMARRRCAGRLYVRARRAGDGRLRPRQREVRGQRSAARPADRARDRLCRAGRGRAGARRSLYLLVRPSGGAGVEARIPGRARLRAGPVSASADAMTAGDSGAAAIGYAPVIHRQDR
jgi:hypothetical protein